MKTRKNRNFLIGGLIVLIVAAIALSGCVDQSSPKSSTDSPAVTNTPVKNGPPPLVTKTPPPPLKIPGAVTSTPTPTATTPKPTSVLTPKATNKAAAQPTATSAIKLLSEPLIRLSDVPALTLMEEYKKSYESVNTPYAMQVLGFKDAIGKPALNVQVSLDGQIGIMLDGQLQNCKKYNSGPESLISCGSANFGEKSLYWDASSNTVPGYQESTIMFKKGDYYVIITVFMADKDKSHSEAARLAGIAEGRMK